MSLNKANDESLLSHDCQPFLVAPALTLHDSWKDKVTIVAGTSKMFKVPYTGYPEPKIVWTYNNKPELPRSVTTKADDKDITINLAKMTRTDAGVYIVKVSP